MPTFYIRCALTPPDTDINLNELHILGQRGGGQADNEIARPTTSTLRLLKASSGAEEGEKDDPLMTPRLVAWYRRECR